MNIYSFSVRYIEEAIQSLEDESCLKFENIKDFMMDYLKDVEDKYNDHFFEEKDAPPEYPDYL